MRKLASIQEILRLDPIPDADRIEKATILGWEVVVKKGEFNVGDKCIYCEIDSVMPDWPVFEFLRNKKFRIKTQKLRGIYSQGICFPLSLIREINPSSKELSKFKIDDDVSEILKITKYDPFEEEEEEITKKSGFFYRIDKFLWKYGFKKNKRKKKDSDQFPIHLCPKTDETRCQSLSSAIICRSGNNAYITEKLDGSSTTYIMHITKNWFGKKKYNFYPCSRNLVRRGSKAEKQDKVLLIAQRLDIENKLKKLRRNIAVQGECVGQGLNGNLYKMEDFEFRTFLMWDIDKKQYLPLDEFLDIANKLGLETVPILEKEHKIFEDPKKYVEMSTGKSKINPKIFREGIVVRMHNENFSFKSVSPEYLLKYDK